MGKVSVVGCSVGERPLPHNLDAERAVLGAILLDGPSAHIAFKALGPGDFFLREHRLVFGRMSWMASAGKAIDLITLVEELQRHREVEASGGVAYVAQLVDGVPRTTNVDDYARIVKEKAVLRSLAYAGEGITEAALNPEADADEVLERLQMLSAQYREGVRAERKLPFRTGAEVAAETPDVVTWLAYPWLAAASITELAGKVKLAGKTTFAAHLVRAVLDGATFLGQPTTKTPVVYLTEQPPTSFRAAMARAGLLGRSDFVVLYWNQTVGISWEVVAQAATEECKRRSARLLVVDTLAQFAGLLGDEENNSGDALKAMQPLQLAAAQGIGVLVERHERKSGGPVGEAGRGSSAYAGAVDIVLSLRRSDGNVRSTVRAIHAISRFGGTPDELLIELTPHGYVALGTGGDVAAQEARDAILAVAPRLEDKAVTLDDLIGGTTIKRATAQRVIQGLLAAGRLARVGVGRRGDPFRYWIPENASAQTSISDEQKETQVASEALQRASEEKLGQEAIP